LERLDDGSVLRSLIHGLATRTKTRRFPKADERPQVGNTNAKTSANTDAG